jgi:hypothetical protein
MKSNRWYVKFPKDAYALVTIEFKEPVDINHIRMWAREWSGMKRLPKAFECYPIIEVLYN